MTPTQREQWVKALVERTVRSLEETVGDEGKWDLANALAKAAVDVAYSVGMGDAEDDE